MVDNSVYMLGNKVEQYWGYAHNFKEVIVIPTAVQQIRTVFLHAIHTIRSQIMARGGAFLNFSTYPHC